MSEKTKAEERREFIREHASRIDAARLASLVDPETMRPRSDPSFMLPSARVWELAKELWDAKPEDC